MSRVGFSLFKHLFENFGTEIIVISETGSKTLDSKEVFDEIVSLLLFDETLFFKKTKFD